MRIVQTLWPGGKNLFRDNFGWLAPEYHIIAWSLSCLRLREHYNNVILYTDSQTKTIFQNLELPYTEIHAVYDNLDVPHSNLWAFPKILTYGAQREPFLHVDGDVFVNRKFPERLLEADLIAQNEESPTQYYLLMMGQLLHSLDFIPSKLRYAIKNETIKSFNAGIMGGSDLSFFKTFANAVKKFLKLNEKSFKTIVPSANVNLLFEQLLFAELVHQEKKHVECYYKDMVEDNKYSSHRFCNFDQTNEYSHYIHFIGGKKKDEMLCYQLRATLAREYPSFYFRIASRFSEAFQEELKKSSLTKDKKNVYCGRLRTEIINKSLEQKQNDDAFKNFQKLKLRARIANTQFVKDSFLTQEARVLDSLSVFSAGGRNQNNKKVNKNPDISVIEYSFEWPKQVKEGINPLLISEDDLNETKGLALLPSPFFGGIEEIIITELDYNILESLGHPIKVNALFDRVQTSFDEQSRLLPEVFDYFLLRIRYLSLAKCIYLSN